MSFGKIETLCDLAPCEPLGLQEYQLAHTTSALQEPYVTTDTAPLPRHPPKILCQQNGQVLPGGYCC